MAIPDNYSIIQVTSSDPTIRVDVEWDFDSLDELYIWVQDTVTGASYIYTNGDFIVTRGQDETGVFLTVENPTEDEGSYNQVVVNTSRLSPRSQTYQLSNSQALDPEALISALDDIVKMIQEISVGYEYDQQAITSINPFVIADKATRAGVFLAFDENGDIDLTIETDDIKALLADFDTAVEAKVDEYVPGAVDDYLLTLDVYDDTFEVADIPARDALTPKKSDVSVVADDGTGKPATYMYNGSAWVRIASTATTEVTQAEFLVVKNQVDEVFKDVGGTPADGANELSQAVARYVAGGATYQAGGTANAITLSSYNARQGVSIMPEGATFRFIATATNTGSVTVDVQGIGAKTIRKNGFSSNLEAGDLESGKVYEIFYSSSADQFELLNIPTLTSSGGTVLTTRDMTNGGANDLNEIDIAWQSAWDSYDYVRIVVNNMACSNSGDVGVVLSSDGGSTWETFAGGNKEAMLWSGTPIGGGANQHHMTARINVKGFSKIVIAELFSIDSPNEQGANTQFSPQGTAGDYNGTSFSGLLSFSDWSGWNTGSDGLDGYMIRYAHEVGNFTNGTLKLIGYNY